MPLNRFKAMIIIYILAIYTLIGVIFIKPISYMAFCMLDWYI